MAREPAFSRFRGWGGIDRTGRGFPALHRKQLSRGRGSLCTTYGELGLRTRETTMDPRPRRSVPPLLLRRSEEGIWAIHRDIWNRSHPAVRP
ncbi:MAG: hypothetical protein EA421_03230 [Gemmatimonadales bacterium]|nr:MAG: hypothetical protein EA421_03230 [Gemmatimonadales bacterium]